MNNFQEKLKNHRKSLENLDNEMKDLKKRYNNFLKEVEKEEEIKTYNQSFLFIIGLSIILIIMVFLCFI